MLKAAKPTSGRRHGSRPNAEREADKDIEEGRFVEADSVEGIIDELGRDSS